MLGEHVEACGRVMLNQHEFLPCLGSHSSSSAGSALRVSFANNPVI